MPAPMMATSNSEPHCGCVRGSSHSLAGGMISSSSSRASRASSSASVRGPRSWDGSGRIAAPEFATGTTEIGIPNPRVMQQIACHPRQHDAPGLQDVAVVRDLQGQVGILLDHKNGDALLLYLADQLQYALDVRWRQAHRRLVHANEARAAHERTRHG